MSLFSYIIALATSRTGVDVFLAIRNIAGTGHAHYCRSGDFGNVQLWIVPKSLKSRDELVTQLNALPFIKKVSVVLLSTPITNEELSEVRSLFKGLGWDAGDVPDQELSLFLSAKIQGKYTYLIDFDQARGHAGGKIRIIRAEDHPHFSPAWLTNDGPAEDLFEQELRIDDLETGSCTMSWEVDEPPPPLIEGEDDTQ